MLLLADFLGYNSDDWDATIGLVGVFFIAFPLLVHGLIVFIIAQVIGEKRQNDSFGQRRGRRPFSGLSPRPLEDRLRVGDHRAVGELQRRQLRIARGGAKLLA